MTAWLRVDLDAVTKNRVHGRIECHESVANKLVVVKKDTHSECRGTERSLEGGSANGQGKREGPPVVGGDMPRRVLMGEPVHTKGCPNQVTRRATSGAVYVGRRLGCPLQPQWRKWPWRLHLGPVRGVLERC